MIKERIGVNPARLYIQDRKLNETAFQAGTFYSYRVDLESKTITILPEKTKTKDANTVSSRKLKNGNKPIIDLRDKRALAAFEGCDELSIQIHGDRIVVKGYKKVKAKAGGLGKILSIFQAKKKLVAVKEFSQIELELAAGDPFGNASAFVVPGSGSKRSTFLEKLRIPLQILSLFSGAGMMDLGFAQEGFQIVQALDYSEGAVETYRFNFGDHIILGDMRTHDLHSLPRAPIMIAGPNCQGLSNANRWAHDLGNPNNELILKYLQAIRANDACKVFVLENVKQILTAGGGYFMEQIEKMLPDFEISRGILNAADYGVAQTRERAIIIGSKIGKINLPEPTHEKRMTVREAFAGLHDGIPNQRDISKHKEDTVRKMSFVPPGGNIHDIPAELRPKGAHSDIYYRLKWDEPSITIVNPRKAMLTHPEENRMLSIRECARLSGIPDWFEFKGNLNSRQQQVANGVPVGLARAVARAILRAVEEFNAKLVPAPTY